MSQIDKALALGNFSLRVGGVQKISMGASKYMRSFWMLISAMKEKKEGHVVADPGGSQIREEFLGHCEGLE